MQADNALTQSFINTYPQEAARILEHLPAVDSVALLAEIVHESAVNLFRYLLPSYAKQCVALMDTDMLVDLTDQAPISLARTLQLLSPDDRQQILDRMPSSKQGRLKKYMTYPAQSAAAVMHVNCLVMPAKITVTESLKRIDESRNQTDNILYVVDDNNKYMGVVKPLRLLSADKRLTLRDLTEDYLPAIHAALPLQELQQHRGWLLSHRLPVVDKNGHFIGDLSHNEITELMADSLPKARADPFESLLSLAGLYWITIARILELVFSVDTKAKK